MDVASRLTFFRELTGFSKNKLAQKSGLSQAYISQLEAGQKKPTTDALERLCDALGVTICEFFADKEPELTPDLRRLLNTARRLTPRQRELLLEVVEEWAGYNETKGE